MSAHAARCVAHRARAPHAPVSGISAFVLRFADPSPCRPSVKETFGAQPSFGFLEQTYWLMLSVTTWTRHGELEHVRKRHFFVCNGETKSWEQLWYTEPFFLSQRASFDRAASDGPVQPPASIIQSVAGCTADGGAVAQTTGTEGLTVSTKTAVATRTQSSMIPFTTTGPNGAVISSASLSAVVSTVLASPTLSISGAASSTAIPGVMALDPMAVSSCAGDLDWQAWGAIASAGAGLILGALVWLLWLLARSKLPELYNARRWFVDENLRPTAAGTAPSFFLPFLHLPSLSATADRPLTEAQITLHVQLAMLKLATIPTVLGLGVALPLIIANVPCLSKTTLVNDRGGRLGSLNDLSLLRLLNALDPSPDSSAGDQAITITSMLSKRALLSTNAPAVSSARLRLILLLVVIALVSLLSAFFVIFRTYGAFAAYHQRFHQDICRGQQMVYINGRKAFQGKNEEGVRKLLKKFDFMKGSGIHAEAREKERTEEREIEVLGVFAIADTTRLSPLIRERARVLDQLEEAATKFIESFTLLPRNGSEGLPPGESPKAFKRRAQQGRGNASGDPTGSAPKGYVAPISLYQLKDLCAIPLTPISTPQPPASDQDRSHADTAGATDQSFSQNVDARVLGSRFVEVNRDSVFYGGRLPIGQRVKITEDGVMVPDDSPPLEGGLPQQEYSRASTRLAGEQRVQRSLGIDEPDISRSASLAAEATASDLLLETSRPRATRHRSTDSYIVVPAATATAMAQSQIRPRSSLSPLTVSSFYNAISEHRARFKDLNEEITEMQQAMYEAMAEGRGIVGWIFTGRGVNLLPGAIEITGRTTADIDWSAVQNHSNAERRGGFWTMSLIVMLCLGVLLIPVVGLALGSAPGFAHHIGILRPLVRSDGFGSGVAETLAPAGVLIILLSLTALGLRKIASHSREVSRTNVLLLHSRTFLALAFVVMVVWVIILAAVLYGIDSFATGTQTARHVGDGSIYFTWILFSVLLNLAIILPAMTVLHPGRLWLYLRSRRRSVTPRQRFRLLYPASFTFTWSYHGALLGLLYGLCLIPLFPLLALPVFVLILLGFAATRFKTSNVWCEVSRGPTAAVTAMRTLHVLAWGLGLSPALYGLIMLSRREWGIGGASLGFAAVIVGLCEAYMAFKRPKRQRAIHSRNNLHALALVMHQQPAMSSSLTALPVTPASGETSTSAKSRRVSNVSTILQMIHTLLPSVSRLPTGPLPLASERIDDLVSTERAARATPSLIKSHRLPSLAFADPARETEGLIYPPELLAPVPVIWLPDDAAGVGRLEAADLARYHGLSATVGAGEHRW